MAAAAAAGARCEPAPGAARADGSASAGAVPPRDADAVSSAAFTREHPALPGGAEAAAAAARGGAAAGGGGAGAPGDASADVRARCRAALLAAALAALVPLALRHPRAALLCIAALALANAALQARRARARTRHPSSPRPLRAGAAPAARRAAALTQPPARCAACAAGCAPRCSTHHHAISGCLTPLRLLRFRCMRPRTRSWWRPTRRSTGGPSRTCARATATAGTPGASARAQPAQDGPIDEMRWRLQAVGLLRAAGRAVRSGVVCVRLAWRRGRRR
jgi:hypothetical protein